MIDFRYHLVSIVAIFLSLAVGLVLGATTLRDPTLAGLENSNKGLLKSKDDLRRQVDERETRIKGAEQFAGVLGPQFVAGRLKGEQVVLIETPGSNDKIREQVAKTITDAGATYTGSVNVQNKYFAEDQLEVLDQLAKSVKPNAVTISDSETPYDRAGAVLASVLVTDQTSRAGREEAAGGEVLAGFKDQGFVTTSGKPGARATLAVVIAPSTVYTGKSGETGNKALVSLTAALDKAGRGTVLAGPPTAAQDGGLIAMLRRSETASVVSTVDTADTSSGQVVTVLALVTEIGGKSGKYGIGSGVDGYLPTPAPSTEKRP
ncbi:copper transporter [Actinomadura sp. HBU206391]|uniref:copper transporter n=1 Tax=Actinomadura sp. HBU206391 TaxID=2731692 RepID=UPI00164F27C4|nr:copper transporter [Actinomadura sp. HBU206391]MBC6462709.1 copper transporter [Actinomadura sp. HBU206391]